MASRTDLNGISSLWKEYKKAGDVALRNRLVEIHFKLVRFNAKKIEAKLPDSIELDDLISAGTFGLMDAVEHFDLARGVKFETYAVPRIRGAILDELRSMDWVPRLVRSRGSKYQAALNELTKQNGHGGNRQLTSKELAKHLGVSLKEAERIKFDGSAPVIHLRSMVNMKRGEDGRDFQNQDLVDASNLADTRSLLPEEELSKDAGFNELIACLSGVEQVLVTLYHRDGYEFHRIGDLLGLSESRISQMHSLALQKIKDSLVL